MDLLQADAIGLDLPATDKNDILDTAARRLSDLTGIDGVRIRAALDMREHLGTTVIHQGVAIPHARLDGLGAPAAVFLRLASGIDFDAIDGHPVDLVFVLLWPTDAKSGSLIGLAELCRLLREPSLTYWLRRAASPREARMLLCLAAGLAAARRARKRPMPRKLAQVPA